ncbi:uncharacterized protein LOC591494 [Strongylocentrotus purpuratus]|uniref:Uncharacterized protein n=1 Tax=Strongylocentrotus purpuratus TaxID=7668 RepID=A0A7M7T1Q7_STRPU|nr:uncharacterized protein LOC591494 [Strongylocentrotus purpuratus]
MADTRRVPVKLRLMTYLCPGLPVEIFEMVAHYLEEKMKCPVYLIYESRWPGPPADRPDPFTLDDVDIAFMNAEPFTRLLERVKDKAELLPVAPLSPHPKSNNKPVYFSDVIVHADNCEKYKEFNDMRGIRWAYSSPNSPSGVLTTLKELKKRGESVMFFGHIVQSGSHVKSIEMVADKKVDAAAINSTTLSYQMKKHPSLAEKLHIMDSWGPLPVHPMVVNSRMSAELKSEIANHLLNMHKEKVWRRRLEDFTLKQFAPVTMDTYKEGEELREAVSKLSIEGTVYY